MEELFLTMDMLIDQVSDQKRYLFDEIDWNNRLLGIRGARGTGKTTLLLQRAKKIQGQQQKPLYASLDQFYFLDHTLLDLAKEFLLMGGTHLFLDKVHKYPRWSRELKLLYDLFPKLTVAFTSSSILELFRGESDLSRRLLTYTLQELSFREYLSLKHNISLPKIEFEDLIENHNSFAKKINKQVEAPIVYFKEYLKSGAYAYTLQDSDGYFQRIEQTVNLILEIDLSAVENMPYEDSLKIKKLLIAIAESAPFTPNVTKLSERLGFSRNFLINAIKLLDRADLVMQLNRKSKGIGKLTKPEKLYLNNTNLIYVLGRENVEIGSIRETFFANQLRKDHQINLAEKGDFLIDEKYTFEIGGSNKKTKQITGLENAYVVRDDLEVGALNIIPLYLFGFLY
jgi:hypothetical protein